MLSASLVLSRAAIGLGVAVGLYAAILGALLTPSLQRFALYAHKINTVHWHDIDNAEQFGFASNQVTPFNITTPDGETLYAWHVLPIDVYVRNENALKAIERPYGPVDDFTKTLPFQLLSSKQHPARVVVNFHGNAGHVAQGWRTDTYRTLTLQPNTHVIAIDYRGFGHSTGSPSETGLITDGTAILNWVLRTANIPPECIVLLGQSLGTAVASAVALNFVDPSRESPSQSHTESEALLQSQHHIVSPTAFAGVVLVAPFSSLPSLMLTYRLGGWVPLLAPLRPFPWLADGLLRRMTDVWPTADRLAMYYQALAVNLRLLESIKDDLSGDGSTTRREMGTLQVIHAVNDMDISYHQTEMICRRMLGESRECIDGSRGAALLQVKESGKPRLSFQIVEHGGHNRIVTYSPVSVAVARAFEGNFD